MAAGQHAQPGAAPDGTVATWGSNVYGGCNIPAPNEQFEAVSGGWYHRIGLRADGSLAFWGDTSQGQADLYGPNTGSQYPPAGITP
jgi:alpha-tubulin suppressor-like RCC1 family protein